MATSSALLIGLLALLAGLAVGKAWERYKLKDGVWVDRRLEPPRCFLQVAALEGGLAEFVLEEREDFVMAR